MGVRDDDNNLKAALGCMFTVVWIVGAAASLTILGVVVWAIIRLVMTYT